MFSLEYYTCNYRKNYNYDVILITTTNLFYLVFEVLVQIKKLITFLDFFKKINIYIYIYIYIFIYLYLYLYSDTSSAIVELILWYFNYFSINLISFSFLTLRWIRKGIIRNIYISSVFEKENKNKWLES